MNSFVPVFILFMVFSCGQNSKIKSRVFVDPPINQTISNDQVVISGEIKGLTYDGFVNIQNNSQTLYNQKNGPFSFYTKKGENYSTKVLESKGHRCSISKNSKGSTDILVKCKPNEYTVDLLIKGLPKTEDLNVVFENSQKTIRGTEEFEVLTTVRENIKYGSPFSFSLDHSSNIKCQEKIRKINAMSSNKTIEINCVDHSYYYLFGTVKGLKEQAKTRVEINGEEGSRENLKNGKFVLKTPIKNRSSFMLSLSSPPGHECTGRNLSGRIQNQNFENIEINCQAESLKIIGSISGNFSEKETLKIKDRISGISLSPIGTFVFSKFYGDHYDLEVTAPQGFICKTSSNKKDQVSTKGRIYSDLYLRIDCEELKIITTTKSFKIEKKGETDLVFYIDNSKSMNNKISTIKSKFKEIIQGIIATGNSVNIHLMSDYSPGQEIYFNPDRVPENSTIKLKRIDEDQYNYKTEFSIHPAEFSNSTRSLSVNSGTDPEKITSEFFLAIDQLPPSFSEEKPLCAIQRTLTDQGIHRIVKPGRNLALVVFTDEDDSSNLNYYSCPKQVVGKETTAIRSSTCREEDTPCDVNKACATYRRAKYSFSCNGISKTVYSENCKNNPVLCPSSSSRGMECSSEQISYLKNTYQCQSLASCSYNESSRMTCSSEQKKRINLCENEYKTDSKNYLNYLEYLDEIHPNRDWVNQCFPHFQKITQITSSARSFLYYETPGGSRNFLDIIPDTINRVLKYNDTSFTSFFVTNDPEDKNCKNSLFDKGKRLSTLSGKLPNSRVISLCQSNFSDKLGKQLSDMANNSLTRSFELKLKVGEQIHKVEILRNGTTIDLKESDYSHRGLYINILASLIEEDRLIVQIK